MRTKGPPRALVLLSGLVALTLFGSTQPAEAAEPLAYVRASSQNDRAGSARLHHPLNLLDDDPESIWCEGGSGVGEGQEIRFF
ncbi:MAG: hypothetical protein AAFQ82_10540, partial [Myxococcota bacterium]